LSRRPSAKGWHNKLGIRSPEGTKAMSVYKQFASPLEFVEACRGAGVFFSRSDWKGGLDSSQALTLTEAGDESRVQRAQSLVDRFSNDVDLDLVYPTWNSDVCGSYPIVPNFLAGVPETMMRRQLEVSDRAPVTLWVCVTSSGGIETEQMEARGIAIMALAMALSQTRAINIRLFSGLSGPRQNHIVSVDLLQPFSLAQAAFMLSSQGFARGLTYDYLNRATNSGGGWPKSVTHGSYSERCQQWRALLPIGEQDIVFPHIFMGDPDIADPIGYCKSVFEKVVASTAEA
jgi:hypothetical protein